MRMADAQVAHAEKMAKGELEYSGKLFRGKTIGLERRGGSHNFNVANFGNRLGCISQMIQMLLKK